ncbi:AMP-binding protein [Actinomadura barringtoniae]|uniref:AMP-binding protein n=1 Tax=Actinomadura barringtoniae TaxID=1427535 RepID=A0A939PAQ4_9ACTN|nr:AMP-binding protein [Actinomadura barringtoniae]MBO2446523.1 AMP-binding protein [Actinomadura barringtoniae]
MRHRLSEQRFRTLADHVESHALTRPDRVALRVDDQALTYARLHDQAVRVAGGLAAAGVERGDRVVLLLPNRTEFVVAWLALCRLGAVAAALNTAFSGEALARAIELTQAEVFIVDREFVASVGDRAAVFVPGEKTWAELVAHSPTAPRAEVSGGDPAMLLFTSGSTGRSKACVLPQRYIVRQAQIFAEQVGLRTDDVLFCPFPLFHVDAAIFTVAPAFILGTTAALARRFSVSAFWDQIREHEATVFDFMGATLSMLYKQPPAVGDADNPARLGWGVPLPGWADDFERRFGIELVELYGLTDAGAVLFNTPGKPRRTGSCGKAVEPFEVRILNEEGFEVPAGTVGELCIRSREPHVMMTEYLGIPEETLRAFAGLWFHTGDLAYRDDDGYFYFVGRNKDVIRRRGENISAFEIEEFLERHPAILEVAAFGVPSELTEEDVMVAAVLRPGHVLSAADLIEFCEDHLPRHMVPRYVEFAAALPRTPTEKVEKHRLAERGVTAATHDRGDRP